MSQAAHVAKALDPNVRKSGDGYMVRCPAHDDNTASLKVSDGKRASFSSIATQVASRSQ
jgi:hypothetical protein